MRPGVEAGLRSYPTARPSGYVSNVEYLMLCSHQRVFAHSLFPSLYLNLSYLFLETYIPRGPTLYNGADTIYRGQSCLSCEGAVDLSRHYPPVERLLWRTGSLPPKSVRSEVAQAEPKSCSPCNDHHPPVDQHRCELVQKQCASRSK